MKQIMTYICNNYHSCNEVASGRTGLITNLLFGRDERDNPSLEIEIIINASIYNIKKI